MQARPQARASGARTRPHRRGGRTSARANHAPSRARTIQVHASFTRPSCERAAARHTTVRGPVIWRENADADFVGEDEPLLAARANAADLGGTPPVPPPVGAVLRYLATAIGARAVVEVGTGCGTSGIWLLRGMRAGGVLTSVDTEPECQRLARKAFSQAGFAANQARLILGRAVDVLPRLSDGAYDLVFCDADPARYPDYLASGLRLLRQGGIIVFNDVFAAAPSQAQAGAQELAELMRTDERLVPLLLPVADGILTAVKR